MLNGHPVVQQRRPMPGNDGSCMVEDCTPYSQEGCGWRSEIELRSEEDYMIKDEIMQTFRQYLKQSFTCHDASRSEIPDLEGYYARANCDYGELTYTAYWDDQCQDQSELQLSFYNIDCWHVGEIEGIDVYLSCEFTQGGHMDDWNDEDNWDDDEWNDGGDGEWNDDEEWDDGGWDKEDWDMPEGMDRPTPKRAQERLEAMEEFSTYNDSGMQDWLWLSHLSGIASWLGWIIMLPLGGLIYTWLIVKAFFLDIWIVFGASEGVDLWKPYMMGPVRRAVMGNFIFWNNVAWSNIPGLSIITSIIFGYWGVADYYDYNYDVETFQPTMPNWMTEDRDHDGEYDDNDDM